jgi:hypothetical protein
MCLKGGKSLANIPIAASVVIQAADLLPNTGVSFQSRKMATPVTKQANILTTAICAISHWKAKRVRITNDPMRLREANTISTHWRLMRKAQNAMNGNSI